MAFTTVMWNELENYLYTYSSRFSDARNLDSLKQNCYFIKTVSDFSNSLQMYFTYLQLTAEHNIISIKYFINKFIPRN